MRRIFSCTFGLPLWRTRLPWRRWRPPASHQRRLPRRRRSQTVWLAYYADHFWLLEEDDGTLVSFVDGMTTDEPTLRDEMYENAALHDEDGTWQMIFGVNTLPAYRRRGCAGAVLERVIADARAQGRRGCVLTCKDKLVHYYEKFGFVNEGVSQSTHGGVVWYDMRLTF